MPTRRERRLGLDDLPIEADADRGCVHAHGQSDPLGEVGGLAVSPLRRARGGRHQAGIQARATAEDEDALDHARCKVLSRLTDVEVAAAGVLERCDGLGRGRWDTQHGSHLVAGPARHDAHRHAPAGQDRGQAAERAIATDTHHGWRPIGQGRFDERLALGSIGRLHDLGREAIAPRQDDPDLLHQGPTRLSIAQPGGARVDDHQASRHAGSSSSVTRRRRTGLPR